DTSGTPVPPGVYYIALYLDPNQSLAESDKSNNASLSWGTVAITPALAGDSAAQQRAGRSSLEQAARPEGDAYDGKTLPRSDAAVRKVRIRALGGSARQMEFIDGAAQADSGPRVKPAESHTWSRLARARQQVVFPVVEAKPMPNGS